MSLLSRSNLEQFAASYIHKQNASTRIRPTSIDLTVGKIYHPKQSKGLSKILHAIQKPGAPKNQTEIILQQGETAVLQTSEELKMPETICGIVFPTNSISMKGLLVTNAGHIDPGYSGHIHVTVINMSRRPFTIRSMDRFLRASFFECASTPNNNGATVIGQGIDTELLERLSPDFLNISQRASETARTEVKKAELRTKWVPVIVAIIAVTASIIPAYIQANAQSQSVNKEIEELQKSIALLKADYERIQPLRKP